MAMLRSRRETWTQAPLVAVVIGIAVWVPLRLLYWPPFHPGDLWVDAVTAVAVAAYWAETWRGGARESWLSAVVDFVAVAPLAALAHPLLGDEARWLLLSKLLMLRRIWLVRAWFEALASLHPVMHRVLPIVLYLPPFVHLIACGWIALGGGTAGRGPDGVTEYVRAVYWALSTLTTVGYGDITARTPVQMFYTCATQLVGVGTFGFIISNVASILSRIDAARERHLARVDRLETYMAHNALPAGLRARVRTYCRYVWDTRQGYHDAEVLAGLPAQLHAEIALHLNRDMVARMPMLQGVGDDLLHELMLGLEPMVAAPGQPLFHVDEPGDAMYFVRSGTVEVVGRDGEVIAQLGAGAYFGEMALLSGSGRTATARAHTYCDLFRLPRETFAAVARRHPKFAITLARSADVRRAATAEFPVVHPDPTAGTV